MKETQDVKTNCFAANLQTLRAQHKLSQEAVAEQLGVSRQSVSKWESGSAFPETETLITLCDRFEVTLDEMMRGDVSTLSLEGTQAYDELNRRTAAAVAGGVFLILFGVGFVSLWEGLYRRLHLSPYTEDVGSAVLLLCILFATMLFIVMGIRDEQLRKQYPELPDFYTRTEKDAFARRFVWLIAAPVGTILADVVLILLMEKWAQAAGYEGELMAGFFWLLGGAVSVLVWAGIQKEKFNIKKYNVENSPEYRRQSSLTGAACGVIMMIATALYIGLAARNGGWGTQWWIFAVGGILCGMVAVVRQAVYEHRHKGDPDEF